MLKTSHLGQNGIDTFSRCGTKEDYQEKIILTYELCDISCVKEELEGDTTALVEVSLANFHVFDYHFKQFIFTISWPLPRSSEIVSLGHLLLVYCGYLLGQIRALGKLSFDCSCPR